MDEADDAYLRKWADYQPKWIRLTPEMRAQLKAHLERTGVGLEELLERYLTPLQATPAQVRSLLKGRFGAVDAEVYQAVLTAWEGLPTALKPEDVRRLERSQVRRGLLSAEIERTGVSVPDLLAMRHKPPLRLTSNQIARFLHGDDGALLEDKQRRLLALWRDLPDRIAIPGPQTPAKPQREERRKSRTADRLIAEARQLDRRRSKAAIRGPARRSRSRLLAEIERTGVSAAQLPGRPREPTKTQLQRFLKGDDRAMTREQQSQALALWKGLPDCEWVELTDAVLARLEGLIARTGKSPAAIWQLGPERPPGLTRQLVRRWLNGKEREARKDFLDDVLARYERAAVNHPKVDRAAERRTVAWRRQTGVNVEFLLQGRTDLPEGLSLGLACLICRGEAPDAPEHFRQYLDRLRQQRPDLERVEITVEQVEALRLRIIQTGVSARALLERSEDCPSGLTEPVIKCWLSGGTKSARKDHLDFVFRAYARDELTNLSDEWFTVTPEIIATLRGYVERTGKGPVDILHGAWDKPEGLTSETVRRWLEGGAKTGRKEYLAYILKLYERDVQGVLVTTAAKDEIRRQIRRTGVDMHELLRMHEKPPDMGPSDGRSWPSRMPEKDLRFFLEAWAALPDRLRSRAPGPPRAVSPRGNSIWAQYLRDRNKAGADTRGCEQDPER